MEVLSQQASNKWSVRLEEYEKYNLFPNEFLSRSFCRRNHHEEEVEVNWSHFPKIRKKNRVSPELEWKTFRRKGHQRLDWEGRTCLGQRPKDPCSQSRRDGLRERASLRQNDRSLYSILCRS